jgi:1,4-alpha-glucan branching enzyme
MPGSRWDRFANLRCYYGLFYTHPGKKLMFMGDEFAQVREWNSDISLDWHLAPEPMHQGIQRLVRDLNHVYRTTPALYEQECDPEGFEYVDATDADQGVLAFLRHSRSGGGPVLVVCHFTPVLRQNYQIGVPRGGRYEERLNTDAEAYGGSNAGNAGGVTATEEPCHGRQFSVRVKLPPFATVILQHTSD